MTRSPAEVFSNHSGIEALEDLCRCASDHPDRLPQLIVLDINTPRLNGHELLERIRDDAVLQKIAVVTLTSSNAECDRTRASRNGADGVHRQARRLR